MSPDPDIPYGKSIIETLNEDVMSSICMTCNHPKSDHVYGKNNVCIKEECNCGGWSEKPPRPSPYPTSPIMSNQQPTRSPKKGRINCPHCGKTIKISVKK